MGDDAPGGDAGGWRTFEEVKEEVDFMLGEWSPAGGDPVAALSRIYKYGSPQFSLDDALSTYEEAAMKVSQIIAMSDRIVSDDEDNSMAVLKPSISKLRNCILESYHMLAAVCGWNSEAPPKMTLEDALFRFSTKVTEAECDLVLVFKFIIAWCFKMNLRHRGDVVYHQIKMHGVSTRAWVPACDTLRTSEAPRLEDLISYVCRRGRNMDIYNKSLSIPVSKLCEKLRWCREADFPMLKTTRSWISFKDGMYSTYLDLFLYYDDERIQFPEDMATCAYHAVNFGPAYFGRRNARDGPGAPIPRGVPVHPLMDLRTPLFDNIMSDQKLCGHTRFWLLAMMGRCLFWSDTFDTWQVVLFIKGRAGTGKSTIVNLLASIYDPNDTCTISNNCEGTFGLMGLDNNKLLWVAPEVKEDFRMDQAQFQSLVSHEVCSIPRKNLQPFEGRIMAQGAMAGNTFPSLWNDNASSIKRRMFMICFNYQVTRVVTDMLERIKTEELPQLIRKMVFCYQRAVIMVGSRALWDCKDLLSDHIIRENEALSETTNLLHKFLSGGAYCEKPRRKRNAHGNVFDWVPETVFIEKYNTFVRENGGRNVKWVPDHYRAIFDDMGLEMVQASFQWGEEPWRENANIIVGCTVVGGRNLALPGEGKDNPTIDLTDSSYHDKFAASQAKYDADAVADAAAAAAPAAAVAAADAMAAVACA
jgi:hypothetical protein